MTNKIETISKTVIVTGASGDIGIAVVQRLLRDGYKIAACCHSNAARLKALAHSDIAIYDLDLSHDESIKDCAVKIGKEADQVAGLVNCAGVAAGSLFGMTKISDMRALFDVNLFGTLLFTQFIAKKLIRQKSGSIINMASTAGIFAEQGTLAYGASKAALLHASRVLAVELGQFGIRVNSIAPSAVNSKMADAMDDEARKKLDQLGSLPGITQPENVADVVAFLISDSAEAVSGETIRVDRGTPF